MKTDVFISYSHADTEFVHELVKRLEAIGIKYFLDEERILWGDKITEKVLDALNNCIAIIIVISPGSLKSQWVPFEIGHAMGANSLGANKMILPLLTHRQLDLPDYLKEFRWQSDIESVIKFFQSNTWKDHVSNSRIKMSLDLRKLRKRIRALDTEITLLSQYLPGQREPEDL